jgi:serine acetyltransferase
MPRELPGGTSAELHQGLCHFTALVTGAGAKVLGSIRIGDDLAIQGNAFVIVDVSWISIAVEVLAKVRAGGDSKRIRAGNEKGRRSLQAVRPPARHRSST